MQGERCRDVACYVWEQGKQGKQGEAGGVHSKRFQLTVPYSLLTVNCSLFPVNCYLFPVPCFLFPIPYSLFPNHRQMTNDK